MSGALKLLWLFVTQCEMLKECHMLKYYVKRSNTANASSNAQLSKLPPMALRINQSIHPSIPAFPLGLGVVVVVAAAVLVL